MANGSWNAVLAYVRRLRGPAEEPEAPSGAEAEPVVEAIDEPPPVSDEPAVTATPGEQPMSALPAGERRDVAAPTPGVAGGGPGSPPVVARTVNRLVAGKTNTSPCSPAK